MAFILNCPHCNAERPFVDGEQGANCYVCEHPAPHAHTPLQAHTSNGKKKALFQKGAPFIAWGKSHCYRPACAQDIAPVWQGSYAFCPLCNHAVAALSKERDAAMNAKAARKRQDEAVGMHVQCTAIGLAAAAASALLSQDRTSTIFTAAFIGILAFLLSLTAHKMRLGTRISDWLYKRQAFRKTDKVVLEAAQRKNVFARPFDALDPYAASYPERTTYMRIYEFKHGHLSVRVTADDMVEVAAMAPRAFGGGCMYPPPASWSIQNRFCGQGYRIPRNNESILLARLAEVAEWMANAQSVFEAGGCP